MSGSQRSQRYNPFRDRGVEHFPDLEDAFALQRMGAGEEDRDCECVESLWSPESQAVLYGEEFSLHNETADRHDIGGHLASADTATPGYWESHAFTRTPLGKERSEPLHAWDSLTPLGDASQSQLSGTAGLCMDRGRPNDSCGRGTARGGERRMSALSELDRNTFYVRDLLENSVEVPAHRHLVAFTPSSELDRETERTLCKRKNQLDTLSCKAHASNGKAAEEHQSTRPLANAIACDTRRKDEKDPKLPLEFRTLLLLQRVARELDLL